MAEHSKTLEDIAKSISESSTHKFTDASFNDQLKETAAKRIKAYKKKIKSYEAKHGNFKEFTQKLNGKASPKQEDQWMDWEAAINMLKAWKQVSSELDSNASK